MRYFILGLLLYLAPLSAAANQSIDQEVSSLQNLIEITKKNLQNQKQLLEQLKKYQQIQTQYLANSDNNELLYELVKEGNQLSESIKNNYLTDLFSTEFLGELSLISQVASKRGIPKP